MREKMERTHVRCYAGIRNEDGIQAFAGARLSQAQQVAVQKDDDWETGVYLQSGVLRLGQPRSGMIIWPDDPGWLRSCAGVRRRRASLG
jgi:hypothetical protein